MNLGEYLNASKKSKGQSAANSTAQRKSKSIKGISLLDNRKSHESQVNKKSNEHVPIAQYVKVAQLNEDIHNKVYYGHGTEWAAYMAKNQGATNDHTTVDSLNQAIGLSQSTMGGQHPMGQKRDAANAAILNRSGDGSLSNDERKWTKWLVPEIKALLLPDMTGAQCRNDMSMDDSYYQQTWACFFPPTKHKIKDSGEGWKQEAHSVKLDGGKGEKKAWTGQRFNVQLTTIM